MRLVVTMIAVFAGTAASASSITGIGSTHSATPSIVEKRCNGCSALTAPSEHDTYKVPVLTQGTQKVEVLDVNGERKLVRTEVWFGGSPVIHVSKVSDWMTDERAIAGSSPATGDGVDAEATTGALDARSDANHAAVDVDAAALDAFELRIR